MLETAPEEVGLEEVAPERLATRPVTPPEVRLEEAKRADSALFRLAEAEAQTDRELGRGLALLWDGERYLALGYVRARDFVREQVGIPESRARWLVRLGRQLLAVPDLDRALAERRIHSSHAIELGAIVDRTTGAEEWAAWIERARTMPIREFRALVRAARAEKADEDPAAAGSASAGGALGLITTLDFRPGAAGVVEENPGAASVVEDDPRAAGAVEDDFGPASAVEDDPEAPPAGGWMSIPAPARVAVLWHGAVDLARAAAGRHLSQGQCAEFVFAEYLSALGPDHEGAGATGSPLHPQTEVPSGSPLDQEAERRERLLAAVIDAMNHPPEERAADGNETQPGARVARGMIAAVDPSRSIGAEDPALDWEPPENPLPEDPLPEESRVHPEQNPRQLADALGCLSHLKQRLRYAIAVELARMQEAGHWHALGFRSFAAYCEGRLGFGLRRAERLLRFKDGLERFPRLEAAYLDGRISYSATLLLLPILHRTTEEAWVSWADGITYRELERVAAYARTFALPDAHPTVLASWVRGLAEQGLVTARGDKRVAEDEAPAVTTLAATMFAEAEDTPSSKATTALPATMFAGHAAAIPLGYALPPDAPGAPPRISGIPADIALAPPELLIAQIRFWLPTDALRLAYRALHRARSSTPNPLLPTWAALELILVHFIQAYDTPAARALARRHRIIARDNYQCLVPGCTSRDNLHSHHLEHRSQGGSDEDSNQATECLGHHIPGQHGGVIDMGGFAPDHLITKLGIDPRTGLAFANYRNERRVSAECAERALADWHAELRARRKRRLAVEAEARPAAAEQAAVETAIAEAAMELTAVELTAAKRSPAALVAAELTTAKRSPAALAAAELAPC